jgi:hypothetical protein
LQNQRCSRIITGCSMRLVAFQKAARNPLSDLSHGRFFCWRPMQRTM